MVWDGVEVEFKWMNWSLGTFILHCMENRCLAMIYLTAHEFATCNTSRSEPLLSKM